MPPAHLTLLHLLMCAKKYFLILYFRLHLSHIQLELTVLQLMTVSLALNLALAVLLEKAVSFLVQSRGLNFFYLYFSFKEKLFTQKLILYPEFIISEVKVYTLSVITYRYFLNKIKILSAFLCKAEVSLHSIRTYKSSSNLGLK